MEAKDGNGGNNRSHKSCKALVKSSPPTNQHLVFLQAGCPSRHPTNSVKALKGKISHSLDLFTPGSPGGLPTLSLTRLSASAQDKLEHNSGFWSWTYLVHCYEEWHEHGSSNLLIKYAYDVTWLCLKLRMLISPLTSVTLRNGLKQSDCH